MGWPKDCRNGKRGRQKNVKISEATIIDKAIDMHYLVITLDTGKQMSVEFKQADRAAAILIVHSLNDRRWI